MERFEGTAALMVGGASGIGPRGRPTSRGRRRAGCGRGSGPPGATRAATAIGGLMLGVDVTDETSVAEMLARASDEFGGPTGATSASVP